MPNLLSVTLTSGTTSQPENKKMYGANVLRNKSFYHCTLQENYNAKVVHFLKYF